LRRNDNIFALESDFSGKRGVFFLRIYDYTLVNRFRVLMFRSVALGVDGETNERGRSDDESLSFVEV